MALMITIVTAFYNNCLRNKCAKQQTLLDLYIYKSTLCDIYKQKTKKHDKDIML